MNTPAFALGSLGSAFAPARIHSSTSTLCPVPSRTALISIFEESSVSTKTRVSPVSQFQYSDPQPGDPGYKRKSSEPPKSESSKKKDSKPAKDLPVIGGTINSPGDAAFDAASAAIDAATSAAGAASRGFKLLREDILQSAPERLGIGRQDESEVMNPQYGEPGYKYKKSETSRVSDLEREEKELASGGSLLGETITSRSTSGESTFMQMKKKKAKSNEPQYDLPDYLQPLPEDTPRPGYTWKNY